MRIAGVTVFIKLVVIPLVFLPIAVLAGSRGPSLLALALAWETPVAVSSSHRWRSRRAQMANLPVSLLF